MPGFLIDAAIARCIYDSRGKPTLEVEIRTATASGRGVAPAGASTGTHEAVELRDSDGLGVNDAVLAFNQEIREFLLGRDCRDQTAIDTGLCRLDATPNKSRLGGNTLIATSLGLLNTAAAASRLPLWRYLRDTAASDTPGYMPLPEIQIIGGGAHANQRTNLQDIMAVPVGAPDWSTALSWCARVYRAVGELLDAEGKLQGVADEGGFWPNVSSNEETLEWLNRGIERAGLQPFDEVAISLDVAANQFYRDGVYWLGARKEPLGSDEWVERLMQWSRQYPILMVEDPCAEDDGNGYAKFCTAFRQQGLVIGDDLVVTQSSLIERAVEARAITGALIKPNQVGTVSEAREALRACRRHGLVTVLSARSGETEDPTVMDLAVGWQTDMVKVGSITRGERTAKWNQGIRIAEALPNQGQLVGRERFPW